MSGVPITSGDIAEALIREFLVKEGCTATLEAFNKEKPKHSNSITKREVLKKALGLDRASAYYRKTFGVDTLPSSLEVWALYQMSKVGSAWGEAPAAQGPARPVRPPPIDAEDPEDASAPVGAAAGLARRPGSTSRPVASGGSNGAAPPAKPAARQGFGLGDSAAATPQSSVTARPAPLKQGFPDSPSSASSPLMGKPAVRGGFGEPAPLASPGAGKPGAPRQGFGFGDPQPTAAAASRKLGAMSLQSNDDEPEVGKPAGPRAPARAGMMATAPARQPRSASKQSELVMEDVDEDFGLDGEAALPAPAQKGFAATMRPGASLGPRKQGTPISPDIMRAVRQLLWGAMGQPPPSWKQGFFFNRHAGLQFGLVQRQGGPCGVLAGVQAHILAALHDSAAGFNTTPREPEQHSALTQAISETLWQARMGPVAALVLPDGEAGAAASKLGYDQLSRAVAQHTASSKEALVDIVRSSLGVLMAPDGWGVVLLVLSLAVTRGVAAIQADMDEPSNGLMGAHGYCTQELVNLIITGTAVSNVFDGNRELDGHVLKGIGRRCRLGMLTLFEWYKYVEVGPSLKKPDLPVWVVCSESHFTVLFALDRRPLSDKLPFDLMYYDELANMESIIRLTVSQDPRGGWTARVGDNFGERGKCEGQNIPPLECVIETRWPGVAVNWNGSEPIL